MKNLKLKCVSLLLSVSPFWASADDLLDVYNLALENDPIYLQGMAQHDADKEIYEQALAVLLPTIKVEASRTETKQEIVSSDNTVYNRGKTSFPTDSISLSLTQSLYSYSNWANFKKSKEEVKRVAAELENVRQEQILRVAEAYFNVLKTRDNFIGIEAEVNSLSKHKERVEVQLANGLARTTDLLDAEARYLQSQARQIELSNELRDALQAIYEITGETPEALATLGEEIQLSAPEPFEIEPWLTNATTNNPNILAKQSALQAAREEIRRQEGGHYPTLDFVFTQNKTETKGSLFGGGSEVDTGTYLVQLTVPLYAGGAVQSKVRESESLYSKSRDELEEVWRKTARETQSSFTGVVSAISKVRALEKSVESYQLAMEVKQESFESGVASSVTVLDALRDLFVAKTEYAAAKYDYLYNNLRLKKSVGTLTIEDLKQINSALVGEKVSMDLSNLDSLSAIGGAEVFQ